MPEPSAGAGQVLVDVKAAGVNPVDTYIRSGQYAFAAAAAVYARARTPRAWLQRWAATCTTFKAGDRVYVSGTIDGRASGAYAQQALCTIDQVHHLPSHVSFAEGRRRRRPVRHRMACALRQGRAVPGETVLIHGASGAVGVAAAQMASAAGLRVFGTAGTERGRQLAREQGAHEVFDHTARRLREGHRGEDRWPRRRSRSSRCSRTSISSGIST